MFHGSMKDEGHLNHTRAAFALHGTMRKLDLLLDQRILYRPCILLDLIV